MQRPLLTSTVCSPRVTAGALMTGESRSNACASYLPGMPRLKRLKGDLDHAQLRPLGENYVHFVDWVTTKLEEAASQGAQELHLMGVTETTVYPDLDGLARELEDTY